jgi:hypothetical protein
LFSREFHQLLEYTCTVEAERLARHRERRIQRRTTVGLCSIIPDEWQMIVLLFKSTAIIDLEMVGGKLERGKFKFKTATL